LILVDQSKASVTIIVADGTEHGGNCNLPYAQKICMLEAEIDGQARRAKGDEVFYLSTKVEFITKY